MSVTNPKIDKYLKWAKLVAFTGGAQVLVQGMGFLSGILVLRLLNTNEYAFYTLANTFLGTMTILADGGIGSGVMSQGAKVWQDKIKLGGVLSTGIFLRKKFSIFSLVVTFPFLFYLLIHNGASWTTTILIGLTLIPAFYAALTDSLFVIIPQLHQSILPIQRNQIFVSFGRLVLSGLSLFIFPWAYIAILASGIPRIIGNIKLRKIASEFAEKTSQVDKRVQSAILKIVKKYMPGAIYFNLSGTITIWLLSIFGTSTAIAQVGALGRFSMILTVVNTLVATLITPRFAKLPKEKNSLLRRYFQILSGLIMMMVIVVSLTYIFPNQILWILGGNYKNLQFELVLCIIGSCLGIMTDIAFALLASRGWMYNPAVYIAANITSIILCALFFNITTVIGVLTMNIGISLVLFIMNVSIFLFNNHKKS